MCYHRRGRTLLGIKYRESDRHACRRVPPPPEVVFAVGWGVLSVAAKAPSRPRRHLVPVPVPSELRLAFRVVTRSETGEILLAFYDNFLDWDDQRWWKDS